MDNDKKDELGALDLSAQNSEAVDRLKKRLAQSRVPSSASLTGKWINWDSMGNDLGQPFNSTKIPLSKLELMRRDSMLAFGLMLSKVPLVRAPWYIKSIDAQRAAFIDGALRRIYGRFILAYTNCFDFGYSAIVKRFEYDIPDWTYIARDDVGSDDPSVEKPAWTNQNVQALVWKPFTPLSPKHVFPHWNASGDFAGIDFGPGAAGRSASGFPFENRSGKPADIPLDWALWTTNEKDSVFGSFWGYPRLGYAYRFWWSYWYKFGLADRAFEKWADPPVTVYYPSDDGLDSEGNPVSFADIALGTAEQARSGANIAMPSGVVRSEMDRATNQREWEIDQLESTANFQALNDTFEYLDVMKLRSMMVPEQAVIEGKGGTSSRNVAATMGDLFQESQAVVMQEIDDVINRYMIPQLLEANFGPGGPPCQKVTTGFDPQDIETMRLIITGYANTDPTKLPVDTRELLDRVGVPVMSHAAFAKQLQVVADQQQKQLDQQNQTALEQIRAKANVGGANATISKTGLYEEPAEKINLDQPVKEDSLTDDLEKHVGLMERFFSLFKKQQEETSPQEIKVVLDVEYEDSE